MNQNQTTIFQPTILQKLLGRNYKWWYIFAFKLKSNGTGLSGHLFGQISDVLQNLAIAYIWFVNGSSNSIITYLVVGRIYKALSDTYFSESLGSDILTGKLSNTLILPQFFVKLTLIQDLGKRAVLNLGRAAGFIIPIIVYRDYILLGSSWLNILILLAFLPLTFLVSFMMEFIFGCSAFFTKDPRDWRGIFRAYNGIHGILSGVIIPLDKLPGFEILRLLPTSYVIHHPMQIYLGKYTPTETLFVFLGGIAWCAVLYLIGKLVFKLGLKKNEAVGL